ncbi:MAG TPA: methylenetetrahydrofolate--tRNA-(uracil(54)-C(5))-methyltransferase (FADH(2)-oxidizing) TrmFO [Oligoflexus sp.]|uniref:methylenetetrahydrofolate--tRNA-(uracil(54)- C(5))-methyltransferase (FADH(2)-oxidizing) TrmFO n=1 Tax=Oligoflexus sp. TaxID=1971216 RepID=UPI002D5DE816|nr:methylenetetrahydrofolate--tRNA-(uracil(54)-C(5))-methyltransferase (FADH(2)-oxidizing) TrmFO [Oligoflexus sp.]HYX38306.1 methylenetetrahydrofolate--tRNA-(uracil(54)-C(5))-methyltransferase (FADH(2)-oxidizing) TrmFO [Oligoflexus sp.]
MNKTQIHIVGGGLAGCEAAWQCLRAGHDVRLYEMRPKKMTPAHATGDLAELVCSNSLKSMLPDTAPGLLKSEMQALDSLILKAAAHTAVPAGQALAVERTVFSLFILESLESFPGFKKVDAEVTELPPVGDNEAWIVASGPLTSQPLVDQLQGLCPDSRRLHFYDAIAPILETESIDESIVFRASRYDDSGDGDYWNVPLNKDEYEAFVDAVIAAEKMPLHDFEDVAYFESCLPIEVMIERGRETLRFGPMKPMGLVDPRTGHRPWAAVQLRMENKEGTMVSMVGFQTKMKWPEQKRVFSLLPGLKDVEFFRFGSVHRNSYLKSPDVLDRDLSFRSAPRIFLAGQITGVEGYTESAAIGLLAGRAASAKVQGQRFLMPPAGTIIGALYQYITEGGLGDFQPMNANLGLLPSLPKQRGMGKPQRKALQCARSREIFAAYANQLSGSSQNYQHGGVWNAQAGL